MDNNVVIIGANDDCQSIYMHKKLLEFGASPYIFDTRIFPNELIFSFSINDRKNGYFKIPETNKKIDFDSIKGCYIRSYKGVLHPNESDPLLREIVYWNNEAALNSFCKFLPCNQINSLESVIEHRYKPLQLQILKHNGIKIPETIITNDYEQVLDVCTKKEYIFKPIRGWANTQILKEEDLTKENLSLLKFSPITLQRHIKGQDIRVYVIGENIYPVGIDSKETDSRASLDNKHYKTTIPTETEQMCLKTTKLLNFAYSAIDIKKTEENEYFILEANATPIFINDEKACNYPISEKICELLLK